VTALVRLTAAAALLGSAMLGPAAAAEQACAPVADASRIAVAGGSLTEILYALGEEERIIAADRTSNYPAEALSLPQIGYVRNLSLEGVLSLTPTLVLGEHDMGPPDVVDRLHELGVSTLRVPETFDFAGIVAKVRCVASALGMPDRGEALVAERLQTAAPPARDPAATPQGMVILRLQNGAPIAAGRDSSGQGLLEMAGAGNVLSGFDGWKPVSTEAMAAAAPDFIVITDSGLEQAGGLEALLRQPSIRLTPAARQGRVFSMDGMAMLGFGLRTAEAARSLRRQLAAAPVEG